MSTTRATIVEQQPHRVTRIVCVAWLFAAMAWPIAQYLACQSLGANPWKLGGWAMYTVPKQRVDVRIIANGETIDSRQLASGRCGGEHRRFVQWRDGVGRWATPRSLAQCVQQSGGGAVEVVVTLVRLGRDGRLERTVSNYVFNPSPTPVTHGASDVSARRPAGD